MLNKYLLVSFILLAVFVILSFIVSPKLNSANNNPITREDAAAFQAINGSHYPALNQLMILLTNYGREVIWTVGGILIFIFGGHIGRKAVIVMALAMLTLIPLSMIAKDVVGRVRPTVLQDNFLIEPDKENAFPSGHTVIVSAGSAVLLILFRDSYKKLIISIGMTIEAGLVSFSRIYVGGHYPLDVAGGVLLGVGIALIFVAENHYVDRLLQPIVKAVKR